MCESSEGFCIWFGWGYTMYIRVCRCLGDIATWNEPSHFVRASSLVIAPVAPSYRHKLLLKFCFFHFEIAISLQFSLNWGFVKRVFFYSTCVQYSYILINKFKFQSYSCVWFWTNTLGERFESLYPSQLCKIVVLREGSNSYCHWKLIWQPELKFEARLFAFTIHRLPAFHESLMPLKNWCSIHARWSKSSLKHSIRFCDIFPSLKQNCIAYQSSKVSSHPDCIFEIYQLWRSGFIRVYSNCCCSCSFESWIMKIGQSSHKMYSNNIVNFQESTTILNACTKKVWKFIESTIYEGGRVHYHIGRSP